jgi:hypothetical protein
MERTDMATEVTFHVEDETTVVFSHHCPKTEKPQGLKFPETGEGWTVVSWDPLTVKEVIDCRLCDVKGFITNGEWVPA